MKIILIAPIITEKSMSETANGKYTFEIDKDANKAEVANAIKAQYKVDAISVNILNQQGKIKKYRGKPVGRTKKIKKAIVRLAKGQKIAEFMIKEK